MYRKKDIFFALRKVISLCLKRSPNQKWSDKKHFRVHRLYWHFLTFLIDILRILMKQFTLTLYLNFLKVGIKWLLIGS